MSDKPSVTVAGAGALGLATALELARAGCRVTVCDPGDVNASAVAAGMLAPVFEAVLDRGSRGLLGLLLAARDLWPDLAVRAGIILDRAGAMAVGDEAWLDGLAADFAAISLRPLEIGGTTAHGLSPGLCGGVKRAILTREDWRIDARLALEALRKAASEAGVNFAPTRVRGRGESDLLVIATGADLGLASLAPELAWLSPIKGHIVRVAAPAAGVMVRGPGIYAAPSEGWLFGATMEAGVTTRDVDTSLAGPLLAAGVALFPGVAGAPTTIQTGVRAATPDGLPMVGPSRAPGVILAVGARRNGWLIAPLVAKVASAYATGADPGPYASQLDPARFKGRP